ncbi:MAG TPA: ATPase, partial [Acidobacteriota bacterium]|nr:ATPase [Acidobacteriota bacterium]
APGKMLRMTGGLGPLQALGVAGSLTLILEETSQGSNLDVSYQVGGYLKDGLASWASAVDGVLGEQFGRLKRFIETGNPE